MDALRLFLIFHLWIQICFGSKTERKKHVGHLVKTHNGKTFLHHATKEKKKSPKLGEKSSKRDENVSRGRKVAGQFVKLLWP